MTGAGVKVNVFRDSAGLILDLESEPFAIPLSNDQYVIAGDLINPLVSWMNIKSDEWSGRIKCTIAARLDLDPRLGWIMDKRPLHIPDNIELGYN